MNIALAALGVVLVLAVVIAVVMAGRIRKREKAEQGTAAGTTADTTVRENSEADQEETAEAEVTEPAETGSDQTADESEDDGSDSSAAPYVKNVHVEVDGKAVLDVPLTGEAKYAIIDGRAVEMDVETTLEDMQGIADPNNHDVNLIYIHDGKVCCSESNCENQVCVHTGELTGSAFDLPIICLPHGVVVQVTE